MKDKKITNHKELGEFILTIENDPSRHLLESYRADIKKDVNNMRQNEALQQTFLITPENDTLLISQAMDVVTRRLLLHYQERPTNALVIMSIMTKLARNLDAAFPSSTPSEE